ncbi:MAG: helix-turn-helix domain-containing protein, partial [[Eubacterium] siraeum]
KHIMADNIAYYMSVKGVDRNQLCDDLNFKYSTVSEWLAAKKYPRIDKIEIMAEYFGITKSDLIEERNQPNEPTPEITDSLSSFNPLEYRSSSDVVRYLRESKNMSQAEFASVLHCTEKTIKNIEEGHKLVSINLARKISNCFGLPMPNTLFSATLYDRYQKLSKRDISIVDTLLNPEEEYVTIQTAARGGDEPGEKKISKSEAEKLLSATPQNDKYD